MQDEDKDAYLHAKAEGKGSVAHDEDVEKVQRDLA
jgi:hypothetical protein